MLLRENVLQRWILVTGLDPLRLVLVRDQSDTDGNGQCSCQRRPTHSHWQIESPVLCPRGGLCALVCFGYRQGDCFAAGRTDREVRQDILAPWRSQAALYKLQERVSRRMLGLRRLRLVEPLFQDVAQAIQTASI
jgi:hypothetical protein